MMRMESEQYVCGDYGKKIRNAHDKHQIDLCVKSTGKFRSKTFPSTAVEIRDFEINEKLKMRNWI